MQILILNRILIYDNFEFVSCAARQPKEATTDLEEHDYKLQEYECLCADVCCLSHQDAQYQHEIVDAYGLVHQNVPSEKLVTRLVVPSVLTSQLLEIWAEIRLV